MKRRPSLLGDPRGLSAVEFTLLCPVPFAFIIGTAPIGILNYANPGPRNAGADAARTDVVVPRRSCDAVAARRGHKRSGLRPEHIGGPVVTTVTDGGPGSSQTSVSYQVPRLPGSAPANRVTRTTPRGV